MFITCGYNFCSDKNALDPSPVANPTVNNIKLTGGIFDHWNVTSDVVSPYSADIPTAWDFLTIMNANFDGTLSAGNVGFALSQISGFYLKRRKVGDFEWLNLKYIPYDDIGRLDISYNDNLAQSGIDYEYALVPIVNDVEGNYITETIGAKFDGVFICDADTVYRFYAGVQYGTTERVQKIGVFEPYGRRYPIVVSNGMINYEAGLFNGTVLADGYLKTGKLDSVAMVKERKVLLDFLTNKKPKILKDWAGNIWLMVISSSPTVSYDESSGMTLANVGADYVEIGDANNQRDLYEAGMVSEVE